MGAKRNSRFKRGLSRILNLRSYKFFEYENQIGTYQKEGFLYWTSEFFGKVQVKDLMTLVKILGMVLRSSGATLILCTHFVVGFSKCRVYGYRSK